MILDKQYYFDIFGVDEDSLDNLCLEALRNGGNYADLYFENSWFSELMLRDSEVSSGGSHVDFGCGVRVLCGEKTGYAYSEATDPASLLAAAHAASAIAQGSVKGEPEKCGQRYFGRPNPSADRYAAQGDWRKADAKQFLPYLNKLDKLIRQADSRVSKVIAMLSYSVSDILMYNSFVELKYDTRPMASLAVSVVFKQGDKTENKRVSRSFRMGTEFICDALIEEIAKDAVSGIDERFEARRPKGGQMPVVMGAGASGILLHEAMGHAFEADFNRKGQSIFTGKIGTQVCPKGINIVDDATIPGNRGSVNFDDEGAPGQKTWMVEDGILTSYLHDRISAKYFGVSPTGNGRRESFRYNPIPRMRATYMENGQDGTVEDLIKMVPKGIYVNEFANGQVKIGEGDFTFYVKSGFMIEDGRLTAPIKDINIIGNGPEALSDVKAVASDLKIDNGTWTCGKGQSVPVSCGMPSVLVGKLTVGGE